MLFSPHASCKGVTIDLGQFIMSLFILMISKLFPCFVFGKTDKGNTEFLGKVNSKHVLSD